VISLRQKQKKLIMLPSETMIWQPEFTDKTLSRKTGAVHIASGLRYLINSAPVQPGHKPRQRYTLHHAHTFQCGI
ncbi:hypothetical protein C6510_26130, partial [Escherichia coli]|nr:hypothetical protein [Escherichia coli]